MTAMAAFWLGITIGSWIGLIVMGCFAVASRSDAHSPSAIRSERVTRPSSWLQPPEKE